MLTRLGNAIRFLNETYRRYRDESTILVYQMGRVGSTSILRAIGERGIQIHNFYARNEVCPYKPRYGSALHRQALHWLFYRTIRRGVRDRHSLKIITLVRDPIERNISMFFHDLNYWLTYYLSEVRPDRARSVDLDTLIDCFRTTFNHRYPLEWFDEELKRLTGIDVYDHAFDTAAGCMRVERERVDLLVVQTEKLREHWHAIEEFVGGKLQFREDNLGRRNWYAPLYAEFRAAYSASPSELDAMYSSRYSTFFFSAATLESWRRRWQKKRVAGGTSANVRHLR